VASSANRVLIDWDWGARGIWTILSDEEISAPRPAGTWGPADLLTEEARPRPLHDKLSLDLLDALQKWNDHGGDLFGPQSAEATWCAGIDAVRSLGEELAAWTQRELGPDYEVLSVTSTGAWQSVEPPWCGRHSARRPPYSVPSVTIRRLCAVNGSPAWSQNSTPLKPVSRSQSRRFLDAAA
jgi:hypothetical protein